MATQVQLDRSRSIPYEEARVDGDIEGGAFPCGDNILPGGGTVRVPSTRNAELIRDRVQELAIRLVREAPPGYACRPADIWVGVCHADRLEDRWNEKYIAGLTHIAAVYRTGTAKYANDMEKVLMRFFRDRTGVGNSMAQGGGGVRDKDGESFVVYIAWRFTVIDHQPQPVVDPSVKPVKPGKHEKRPRPYKGDARGHGNEE